MRTLLLIFISNFGLFSLKSQPTLQWQSTYGGSQKENIYDIQQTADRGFIVLSTTSSYDGDVVGQNGAIDYWIFKVDSVGALEWTKAYGGSAYDWPYSIQQTPDGGYIAAGFTQSDDGDVTGFHGGYDAWILKLSATGEMEWQRAIGGSGQDEAHSIVIDPGGGYVFFGQSDSEDGDVSYPGHGLSDTWVVKLDELGDIVWQKKFGGTRVDIGWGIRATSDSGFILVSETSSNDGDLTENNGNYDFWVCKIDSVGQIQWQNSLGGVGLDVGREVYEVEDGYIACGVEGGNGADVTGHHGQLDVWVVKLNFQGGLVWQRALGGSKPDQGKDMIVKEDGTIVIVGSTKSNDGDVTENKGILMAWVLELDSEGNLVWEKTYGGTQGEEAKAVCPTNDGGFAIGGYTWSEDGDLAGQILQGESDAWLIKFAPESTTTTQAPTHHLELFPNPATHTVFLNTPQYEESLQAIVTDLSGRELYRQQVNSFDGLEVSSLSKGVYLVEAIGEGGVRYVGKLLKQ